jgi:membrane protein implicated in regulation of membrane protease activity
MTLELIFPAFFVLWIGSAALLTGCGLFMFNFSIMHQCMIFLGSCVVFCIVGFRVYSHFIPRDTKKTQNINTIDQQLIGTVARVRIIENKPMIIIHDALWNIDSGEKPVHEGMHVCIKSRNGNTLTVDVAPVVI